MPNYSQRHTWDPQVLKAIFSRCVATLNFASLVVSRSDADLMAANFREIGYSVQLS